MHRVLAALILVLACAPLAVAAPDGAKDWNGQQIAWRTREEGLAEAKRDGKVAIVVAHATWCSVCTAYRKVFADSKVVAASRGFVMILLDVDADADGDTQFQSDGSYIPRTMFIGPDGQTMPKLVSTNPDFRHFLDSDDPKELISLMGRALNR